MVTFHRFMSPPSPVSMVQPGGGLDWISANSFMMRLLPAMLADCQRTCQRGWSDWMC